ncbi:MAG: hypothetical protein WC788_08465 [Candidatus Paceibacterota bacterium]
MGNIIVEKVKGGWNGILFILYLLCLFLWAIGFIYGIVAAVLISIALAMNYGFLAGIVLVLYFVGSYLVLLLITGIFGKLRAN